MIKWIDNILLNNTVHVKTKAAEFSLKTKTRPRLNGCENFLNMAEQQYVCEDRLQKNKDKFCVIKVSKYYAGISRWILFMLKMYQKWFSAKSLPGIQLQTVWKSRTHPTSHPSRLERVYTFPFNWHLNYYYFPAMCIASQWNAQC